MTHGVEIVEKNPSGVFQERLHLAVVLASVWLLAWACWLIGRSVHWPLKQDAPVLIYMGWLANHGMVLYRDIVEIQFPGSILVYRFERLLFGASDLGFRLFDLALLGSALASMLALARRGAGWFAAVFGFCFFLWMHTGTSFALISLGQRDFIIAVILLWGTLAVFRAHRSGQMRGMLLFGLCVGFAATIKPPAAVFFLLPLPLFRSAEFRVKHARAGVAWTGAGALLALLVVLGYLLQHHALLSFLSTERRILPLYFGHQETYVVMLGTILHPAKLLLLLLAGSAMVLRYGAPVRRDIEQQMLLAGTVCGAIYYFAQHKGFIYHREPFHLFFFFWIGWVLVAGLRDSARAQATVCAALLLGASLVYPLLLSYPRVDHWEDRMQGDLQRLHALDRDGQVQCIDTVDGCTTVLLRAQRAPATGFLDQYLFFSDHAGAQLQAERLAFLDKLEAARPGFIVVTNNQWPLPERGYDRLTQWPAFNAYLASEYTDAFEVPPSGEEQKGYRVYSRR